MHINKHMKRDLTQAQFDEKCERLGFRKVGFMGYYELADGRVSVSVWNAGKRRRDQLRYLIKEAEKQGIM